ncbi:MAG TPA: hypothetical protein VGE62_01185 [Candidatus Paceibacterota bacterium]
MQPNESRNKEIVRKRVLSPLEWTYGKMSLVFKTKRQTIQKIFKRDIEKYATKKEIANYNKLIAKAN